MALKRCFQGNCLAYCGVHITREALGAVSIQKWERNRVGTLLDDRPVSAIETNQAPMQGVGSLWTLVLSKSHYGG